MTSIDVLRGIEDVSKALHVAPDGARLLTSISCGEAPTGCLPERKCVCVCACMQFEYTMDRLYA